MSKLDSAKKSKETNWSAIWVLPAVALLITLWLGWQAYQSRGIVIHVEFETGYGIQVNKTNVMYKGIAIGKVTDLKIDEKASKVVASIEVEKDSIPYLGEKSLFWLVSPKVSLAGVTGLETIVSGVYIAVEPVAGEPTRQFTALNKAPSLLDNAAGLHLTLQANKLSSLDQGSPIYYRQIQVGEVKDYQLSDDQKTINVRILIEKPYEHLVSKHTRFWNASGITMTGGLSGFKVHADSLISIISGGISFDTPEEFAKNDTPVDQAKPFRLYEDFDAAQAGVKVELKVYDLVGLSENKTAVMYQGIQVGILRKIKIAPDYSGALVELSMDPRVEALLNEGTEFWAVKPSISLTGISGLETLFRGNYLEVRFSKVGKPVRQFTIRPKAPPLNTDAPGLHLVLISQQLGSLDVGSPILYKQLAVGSVQSYQLSKDNQKVVIGIHIEPEYASLVNESTRFWNASGITVKGGLSGLEVKSESLQTLVLGGIAFDTPDKKAKPVTKVKGFPLYATEDKAKLKGELITLNLNNSDGLIEGTPIRLRGIEVGIVESVSLSKDLSGVQAKARITEGADLIIRSNSVFWIAKPELGLLKTSNLETLITGVYLEVQPGTKTATKKTEFNVMSAPPAVKPQDKGLRLVLTTPRKGSLKVGLPVTYREIPVGRVTDFKLSPQADRVLVGIIIDSKYAPLVHTGSRFWNSSGIGIEAGIFKGVRVRTESLETIIEGGIAFATPKADKMGLQATSGTVYFLYSEPEEKWLKWAPKIQLKP